jgi:hypothetical protein
VQLVEMELAVTVRLTTAGHPLSWGGHTWAPAGLGQVNPIEDDAGEIQAVQFDLPGVSPAQLSLALTEPVEGKTVRIYDALLDPADGTVADAVVAWVGSLNVPAIEDGPQATVAVTAEHRGMLALRPKPTRYTNDEQQRLHTGDTSLDIDPATDAAPLAWPAATYFRK